VRLVYTICNRAIQHLQRVMFCVTSRAIQSLSWSEGLSVFFVREEKQEELKTRSKSSDVLSWCRFGGLTMGTNATIVLLACFRDRDKRSLFWCARQAIAILVCFQHRNIDFLMVTIMAYPPTTSLGRIMPVACFGCLSNFQGLGDSMRFR